MTKTFAEKLKEATAKRQAEVTALRNEDIDALLSNTDFVETQRHLQAKEAEVLKLSSKVRQLNSIKPFIATDGTKYNVNVYPVNYFSAGLSHVLGIISNSRSAFTDEMMLEYSAISGLSSIELMEAREAMGQPAYTGVDGIYHDAVPANLSKLQPLLKGIFMKLDIHELKAEDITQERINAWFARSETKAKQKEADFHTNILLDNENDFTMDA